MARKPQTVKRVKSERLRNYQNSTMVEGLTLDFLIAKYIPVVEASTAYGQFSKELTSGAFRKGPERSPRNPLLSAPYSPG